MDFAPKQDWQKFEALVADYERQYPAEFTLEEKFEKYAALFNLLHSAKPKRSFEHPLEQQRWEEKLKLRQKMVAAFHAIDERKRGQNDSTNAQ